MSTITYYYLFIERYCEFELIKTINSAWALIRVF